MVEAGDKRMACSSCAGFVYPGRSLLLVEEYECVMSQMIPLAKLERGGYCAKQFEHVGACGLSKPRLTDAFTKRFDRCIKVTQTIQLHVSVGAGILDRWGVLARICIPGMMNKWCISVFHTLPWILI